MTQTDAKRTEADLESLVARVLEDYLADLEAGRHPDQDSLLAAHPMIADRLRACFDSLKFVEEAAGDLSSPSARFDPPGSEGTLGDFRILREIGRGGMGVVYEAQQVSLGRRVALKVLPFAAMLDSRQLVRFQNEARAAASLDHPNIVSIYSVGCERGVHYYAMQYIEGRTLAQVIEEMRASSPLPRAGEGSGVRVSGDVAGRGFPDPAQTPTEGLGVGCVERTGLAADEEAVRSTHPTASPASPDSPDTDRQPQAAVSTKGPHQSAEFFRTVARLGIQAAEALDHAHQSGVVHRDIKPSNLMVDDQGHLWITDFGLAMTHADPAITATGDVLGTLRYMSPEQSQGDRRRMDHRTDIYSLGVTLYELVTLQPAFPGDDRETVLRQLSEDDPPSPRRLNPTVPKDLETIVLKAMAKDPERRYATAQEMAEDLKRFLAHEPIRARRPTLSDRAAKWARRHRAVAWSAAVATVVCALTLVASAALVFAAYRGEKQQREIADANAVKAQENYDKARQAVDDMYTGVAEKWLEQKGELTGLQREFLEKALAFYQEFSSEEGADPQVRSEAVLALQRVGAIQEKLGKLAEAEAAFAKSVKQSTDLLLQHPDQPEFRLDLAMGQLGLAWICRETGRTQEADQEADRANERLTTLGGESFTDGKQRQRLAEALQRLCGELTLGHRVPEAEAAVLSALKVWESLVKDFPAEIEYRYGLATNYSRQGMQRMWWGGQNEKAEAALREAVTRVSLLQKERPDDVRFRRTLANVLTNLGVILGRTNRRNEELEVDSRAVRLFEGLAADFPEVIEYQDGLGVALYNLANTEKRLGRRLESDEHYRTALGVYERLADRHADAVGNESSFVRTSRVLVASLTSQAKHAEARQILERALSRAKKALKRHPAQYEFIVMVLVCSTERALDLIDIGDHAQAARAIEDSLALFESTHDPKCIGVPEDYDEFHRAERLISEASEKFVGARILMRCASLAERDSVLSPTDRKKAVQTYTQQAEAWLKAATRTADEWTTNLSKVSHQFGTDVVGWSEIRLAEVAGLPPHRREDALMAECLLIRAIIRKAIALKPDDPTQYQIADLLTTAPEGLRDSDLALKLARRAVEQKPADTMCLQSLGWALYRAGDWKGSIETLAKSHNDKDSFVGAMAYWQLGDKRKAKDCFDRANVWLEVYEKNCEELLKKNQKNHPTVEMEKRLQAEAAALLGVPVKPPAVEKTAEKSPVKLPAAKEKTEKPK